MSEPSGSQFSGSAGLPQRSSRATQQPPRATLAMASVGSDEPFEDPTLRSIADALMPPCDPIRVRNLVMQARTRHVGWETADTMRLVDLALRQGCPVDTCITLTQLPHFDMHAGIEPHGRTMLGVAVELNAHVMAVLLMRAGARLDDMPSQADEEMREWVTAVTHVDKLYPNGLPENATALDHVLLRHEFQTAYRMLKEVRNGRTERQLWEDSVGTADRPDREDIRRGMLVVGDCQAWTPDAMAAVMHKVGFKTSSKPTMDHLKTLPYHSPERQITCPIDDDLVKPEMRDLVKLLGGAPINLNGKVLFADYRLGDGGPITCQELAHAWTEGLDHRGKFDYQAFKTPEDVKRNVPRRVRDEVRARLPLSPRVTQTSVADGGKRLAKEFRDMESLGDRMRPLILCTEDHAIGVALRIKNKPEDGLQTKYVAKVFDPNVTNGHKRVASIGDLRPIENLHLKQLMPTPHMYDWYFAAEREPTVLSFASPAPGWKQNLPRKAVSDRGRRLEEPWTGPIDVGVLQRLFHQGFEGELRGLEPRIRARFNSLPRDAALELLLCRTEEVNFGVHSMLKDGNAHTMKWYCEFLTTLNLSADERKLFVTHLGIDGTTPADGPFSAATLARPCNAQAVRAYFEHALPLLTSADALDVLNSRLPDGCPVIFQALGCGNEEALDLYCAAAQRCGMSIDMKRAILTDTEQGLGHICNYAAPEPHLRQAYDELVVGLGMQDDPDVVDVRLWLDDQAMADPDKQAPRLQRAEALAMGVLQAGSPDQQARRRDLEDMLQRQLRAMRAPPLGAGIGICQTDRDLIMVPAQRADKAFLKYSPAPEKQELLQQALIAFSDRSTMMHRRSDDGYAYRLDSPLHGPCRVEFRFARNAVTELRVLDADGDTLAAMRPTIDRVPRPR